MTGTRPIRATYRLQFHAGFTFADAEALVPYFERLGISHVYASPITTAAPGSTHGYDVVDPTTINPELGGEPAFRSLVAALHARGMGIVIDIVPNHMGVATGTNAWWEDVLTHGRDSAFATVFDIDWGEPIVLPVLGTPLAEAIERQDLSIERHDGRWHVCAYGEHRFPLRDADQDAPDRDPLPDVLARQHYRLTWWRAANDTLNWRRFFSINELAGVRIEDPAVFERTHALILRLHDEGLIDGVRIDHVDGLSDPVGYTHRLRQRLGPDAWIVVEKILAPGEPQPHGWGIDGTSGYDAMEQLSLLLHDPAGEAALRDSWRVLTGDTRDTTAIELEARQQLLAWQFTGQLERCVGAFVTIAPDGVTPAMLRRAIERLLWVFPVYRTYGIGTDAPESDAAIRAIVRDRVAALIPPGEAPVTDFVLACLAGDGPRDAADAVRRFQQLSAPIAAKALEDTAFYRHAPLLSRNEVGSDFTTIGIDMASFHQLMQDRARDVPQAMLTTATHDHKRGEDARARLATLTVDPAAWHDTAAAWMERYGAEGVDRRDLHMLLQTLVGAWPAEGADAAFAQRIRDWQVKSLREGKQRSSWEAPDERYEAMAGALVDRLCDDARFREEMATFQRTIAPLAEANTLVQVALRCTLPGVPDLYQGTELPDHSLVDPDNRRPVDFAERQALLGAAQPPAKLALIDKLLAMRRQRPELFREGDYHALAVEGDDAGRIVAFERRWRGEVLRCAMAIRGADATSSAAVHLSNGDRLTAADAFCDGPVWVDMTG